MARSDRANLMENGSEGNGLSKTKKIVISTIATAIIVAAVVAVALTLANRPGMF